MRIALFTDGIYPYVIGGMQKHSFYLAKYMAMNGVDVDLYHTNQSKYDICKLEFFTEEEKKHIHSFVIEPPKSIRFPGHYIRNSYNYSNKIFELFKKNTEVDFIYAKGFTAWKLLKEKKKGFMCAPIGVNFHGYEMFQKPPSFKARLQLFFLLRSPVLYNIKHADFLFSYGGKITEIIRKRGIKNDKIIEIPTGIEPSWLNESISTNKEKRKFIFIGRYERRKGVPELTEVLKELISEYDFEFHFIGYIPEKLQIKSDKIIYHGSISNGEEIKKKLRSCDVLVCPSYSEGMPNVILEAMASGLAIIATDVGAVNIMVSEKNGWLIALPDKTILKEKIINAIQLPERQLHEKKTNSVEKVRQNFLWERIIELTLAKIKQAIS